MSRAFQLSLIFVVFGSVWNPIHAQDLAGRNHPEIVQALTCRDLTSEALSRGGLFRKGQIVLGIPSEYWTKQDLRQIKEKFNDCDDQLNPPFTPTSQNQREPMPMARQRRLRQTSDQVLESRIISAPDPDADAQKIAENQRRAMQRQQDTAAQQEQASITAAAEQAAQQRRIAERQRADEAAQEQAKMQAAANQAEDQRRFAEQQQRLATMTAQSRAAEVEAQAQDLRNQQTAADQIARDRKQQTAVQAAADQATAERIAKAKRDQLASETAAEEAAQKMPKPLTVDCTRAALLVQVQAVLAKRTNMEVFKVYNSEPNATFTAYLAAPALERVRMSKQIFSVPQCHAMAMTSSGEMPLAFRVFNADGEPFIEITDRN